MLGLEALLLLSVEKRHVQVGEGKLHKGKCIRGSLRTSASVVITEQYCKRA